MKHIIILTIVALLSMILTVFPSNLKAQYNPISIQIEGCPHEGRMFYLYDSNTEKIDSALAVKGNVVFNTNIKDTVFLSIFSPSSYPDYLTFIALIFLPNDTVTIKDVNWETFFDFKIYSNITNNQDITDWYKKMPEEHPDSTFNYIYAKLSLDKDKALQLFFSQRIMTFASPNFERYIDTIHSLVESSSIKGAKSISEGVNALALIRSYIKGEIPFPNLTGKTLDNQDANLYNLDGKYILIVFWASWCGPCLEKIPTLKKLYQKYHAQGLEIFGFSQDTDFRAWARSVTKNKLPWTNIMPENQAVMESILFSNTVPRMIILDKKFNVVKFVSSDIEAELEELFEK